MRRKRTFEAQTSININSLTGHFPPKRLVERAPFQDAALPARPSRGGEVWTTFCVNSSPRQTSRSIP
ncbi:hypothetical protein KL86PLE_90190 [uncultured Pleomorphomonas sp.]|uniref:Uncharacterized protein n=1 Tax=uncultured Pleomorphomonas sp. TaxID=442121 RepID=A0A212LNB2_9HYPH|nr:hypothetical protein KL86PLE_90190 [uncultured Pleomorphomonas sp.]